MKYNILAVAALTLATAAGAQDEPAPARAETAPAGTAPAPLNVHDLRPAAVPLVALPLDTGQKSDPIWVKGERPKENNIAAVTLRPVAGAVVEEDFGQGPGKAVILSRALAGPAEAFETAGDVAAVKHLLYCANGSGARAGKIVCLADGDGDGRFESLALGLAEAGSKVEQLSILGKADPLPEPVAYRAARPDELPTFAATYSNCARDHDRPRYSFAAVDKASALTAVEQWKRIDKCDF